jgi:predicted ABC-type transport system involved in lysophospholipase L1 biosynthesis ATPase subunit
VIAVTHDPEHAGRAERCVRIVDGSIAADERAA